MLSLLAQAPGLRVQEYRCEGRAAVADERNDRHEIVFVRRGAFRIEAERGDALVDAHHLLLLHRDERFRVRHPADCGDRCLVLGFDEALPAAVLGAAAIDDRRPEAPFRRLTLPCPRELHAAAGAFRERLRRAHGDPLLAAEGMLALAERALGVRPQEPPWPGARAAAELVEAVRLELARRLGERLPLAELARAVGASPFHLARLFRRATGSSIHQYRLELRLREAHERVADGAGDLTALALELGFADHAHFTNAFRRRWGAAPSRLRPVAAPARLSDPRPRRPRPGAA